MSFGVVKKSKVRHLYSRWKMIEKRHFPKLFNRIVFLSDLSVLNLKVLKANRKLYKNPHWYICLLIMSHQTAKLGGKGEESVGEGSWPAKLWKGLKVESTNRSFKSMNKKDYTCKRRRDDKNLFSMFRKLWHTAILHHFWKTKKNNGAPSFNRFDFVFICPHKKHSWKHPSVSLERCRKLWNVAFFQNFLSLKNL